MAIRKHSRPSLLNQVNALCMKRLGRKPDLTNPRGFNDIMQWLKLYDQTEQHIVACDKYEVRDLVAQRVGSQVLNECHYVADTVLPNDFTADDYVLKATHDSGSTHRVRGNLDVESYRYARRRVLSALSRMYGTHKGEWAYWFVKPRVMAEEALPEPVVDYKFQCTHGKVRFVRVTWARDTSVPREAVLLPDGTVTKLHMDHKMAHTPLSRAYPGDEAWERLIEVALALAEGWRCIRVDLYYVAGSVRFGELTHWPASGTYKTDDEPRFGEMMEVDLSYKNEPLVE